MLNRPAFMALMALSALAMVGGGCTQESNHESRQKRQQGDDTEEHTMPAERRADPQSVHAFTMTDIDGNEVNLGQYRGKVILLVNVASKCGFTGQYEGLQKLHEFYENRGFTVLGFPANDFMGQEPGTNAKIKQFCSTNYGVTFPMFAKISVKGADQHPLYRFLTSEEANPDFGGPITWNFNKFLVDRSGRVMGRFGSRTKPQAKKVIEAIEAALGNEPN